jgi:hypothetical protein
VFGTIAYPPFMTENHRELPTTVGLAGIPKAVAPQRLVITSENHQGSPSGNPQVLGSSPSGGTKYVCMTSVDA